MPINILFYLTFIISVIIFVHALEDVPYSGLNPQISNALVENHKMDDNQRDYNWPNNYANQMRLALNSRLAERDGLSWYPSRTMRYRDVLLNRDPLEMERKRSGFVPMRGR